MQLSAGSQMQAPFAKGFGGKQLSVVPRARVQRAARCVTKATQTDFPNDWLNKQPIVPVIAFFGWTLPTNIPVPLLNNHSLFQEFLGSIAQNLSHFPKGPGLEDRFWLYFAVYHVGLFTTLLLGQIGVNGRKQGYW